ncbi:MAG TPA: M42 family metallopeptidase [Phototrophicaceae bacterium]|nr:M42 family metallopeptidase [Phototrophicaceae bacterium]
MLDVKQHLKALVETHAPSGHESPIRVIVREAWHDLTDEFTEDRLGSLVGIKRATRSTEGQSATSTSPARRVMLAAHMDEIGLMVRDIVDGFLYVHRISGVDNRVMPAQPVLVHGKRPLPGIVATVPPHLLTADARRKYPTMNELIVDVGLPADEVAELVQIGDLITPDVPLLELQGRQIAAKALDDRACVAAITVCLDLLKGMQHSWDVYATATVQEETGLYGAKTAAYMIRPDIAIALDVTFGKQSGVDADSSSEVGGGPVIGLGPNFHLKLNEQIRKTAKYHEIRLQDEPINGNSGTDAWAIQVSQGGVPTGLLSIPIRNMHSPVETVDLRDIERTGRLLAHFIAGLSGDFLQTIDYDQPVTAVTN